MPEASESAELAAFFWPEAGDGSVVAPGPADVLAPSTLVQPDGMVMGPDGRPVAAPSAEGGVEVREGRVGYRVITSSAEGSILGFGANVSAPSDSNWPVRAICRIAAFRPLREEDRSLQASQPGG